MTRTVEHTRNQALIIWANKAFPGRYGRYVAIRLKGRSLSVAVRHHDMLQRVRRARRVRRVAGLAPVTRNQRFADRTTLP